LEPKEPDEPAQRKIGHEIERIFTAPLVRSTPYKACNAHKPQISIKNALLNNICFKLKYIFVYLSTELKNFLATPPLITHITNACKVVSNTFLSSKHINPVKI